MVGEVDCLDTKCQVGTCVKCVCQNIYITAKLICILVLGQSLKINHYFVVSLKQPCLNCCRNHRSKVLLDGVYNQMGDHLDVGNLPCRNSLGSQAGAVVIE